MGKTNCKKCDKSCPYFEGVYYIAGVWFRYCIYDVIVNDVPVENVQLEEYIEGTTHCKIEGGF